MGHPSDVRDTDCGLSAALDALGETVATERVDFRRTTNTSQTIRCTYTHTHTEILTMLYFRFRLARFTYVRCLAVCARIQYRVAQ